MLGLSVGPKLVGETRVESLDISASLGPTDVPASASVALSVYTGTDAAPSAIIGAVTVDTIYNLINMTLNATGVAGCIYQGVVTLLLVSGAAKTFTFFLAVLPDAV